MSYPIAGALQPALHEDKGRLPGLDNHQDL